jgi:hypothetical protein
MSCCGGKKSEKPVAKPVVAKIVQGVAGLCKAAAGVGTADKAIIKLRRELCAKCEHASAGDRGMSRCGLCGCFIRPKTVLKDQECPDKRWGFDSSQSL